MSSTLPDRIDPRRAADSRAIFSGSLPQSDLPRVLDLLADLKGDVRFRMAFVRDEEQRPIVRVEVEATLTLGCQRCLEPMDHRVDARSDLALVSGMDEARLLPACYDPLLVTEELVQPQDLIEDELLLGLPQIPLHGPGTCRAETAPADTSAAKAPVESVSPFAALAQLRNKTER